MGSIWDLKKFFLILIIVECILDGIMRDCCNIIHLYLAALRVKTSSKLSLL